MPAEIALAFKDAYRMLHQRIGVFVALPIRSLDKLSLQKRLAEIGRMDGRRRPRQQIRRDDGAPAASRGRSARHRLSARGRGRLRHHGAAAAGGNDALALLGNTLPTGAILVVLILIFGPVSGAHFNPAVSIAFALRRELPWRDATAYIAAQIVGGGDRRLDRASDVRTAALAGLAACAHGRRAVARRMRRDLRPGADDLRLRRARRRARSPFAVGLYITAAYWFTASTSFANPAVTIARALSDTFAGIAPSGVAAFIAAQIAGMLAAVALAPVFWPRKAP